MENTTVRDRLHNLMRETLEDQLKYKTWDYYYYRPMPVPATWHPKQHVKGDCSKGIQYLCKWAGAPDPMGNDWADWGNSQTLWSRLQHLPNPEKLEVGDIVTFGRDGEEHAAMVLEKGKNPLLWSFGHQGAPNTYYLDQDRREKQYLRLPVPYLPTPSEKLRSKTGWFSWVAWRLGEGDWKNYKKADKSVRPNVPKLIPPNWWKRYAKFIVNRKKGNKGT
jgi:hypothetical protein